jgi:hypothetical protein
MDPPYTDLVAENIKSSDFDDTSTLFESYALQMLGKIIVQEENVTKRMSGLRIFCRLDISLYREASTDQHQFFVNEITRSHGTALFQPWDTGSRLNLLFSELEQVLHLVGSDRLFMTPPAHPRLTAP